MSSLYVHTQQRFNSAKEVPSLQCLLHAPLCVKVEAWQDGKVKPSVQEHHDLMQELVLIEEEEDAAKE